MYKIYIRIDFYYYIFICEIFDIYKIRRRIFIFLWENNLRVLKSNFSIFNSYFIITELK